MAIFKLYRPIRKYLANGSINSATITITVNRKLHITDSLWSSLLGALRYCRVLRAYVPLRQLGFLVYNSVGGYMIGPIKADVEF